MNGPVKDDDHGCPLPIKIGKLIGEARAREKDARLERLIIALKELVDA